MLKRLLVPLLTTVLTLSSVAPVLAGNVHDIGPQKVLNMSVAEKLRAARGCVHPEPTGALSAQSQTGLIPPSQFALHRPTVRSNDTHRTAHVGHPPLIPSSHRIRAP